ncbi:uncharacterized protein TNCV_2022991 [Trichonephila clavipes]|nr:uncharacterized protein TNCV_2022991 [Trichonephila clavipes]
MKILNTSSTYTPKLDYASTSLHRRISLRVPRLQLHRVTLQPMCHGLATPALVWGWPLCFSLMSKFGERDVISEGKKKKDFNEDHREEIIDFVQSIPGFQECDADVETRKACDAEDCGFQMLNDDEIVTSVQEESDHVDDKTDEDEDNNNNASNKGPSNADAFSVLDTAMEWCKQ